MWIIENLELVLLVATSLVTIASIITDNTDTPAENSRWFKYYKIIEAIALLNKKAKQLPKKD